MNKGTNRLYIHKYGGTSIDCVARIKIVAENIIAAVQRGESIVVVLSAMRGETDRLARMAYALSAMPDVRDYDQLLATGELVSCALLSIFLNSGGCIAKSYTGAQVGIVTDTEHGNAHIDAVNTDKINSDIAAGIVPIVSGFQGVSQDGSFTTLGRGGSDLTAVVLANFLNADECLIYTDVLGIYSADPGLVPKARFFPAIDARAMCALAKSGAKVLQYRAAEYAYNNRVPLRVLSSFDPGFGSVIHYTDDLLVQRIPQAGILIGLAVCGPVYLSAFAPDISVDQVKQQLSQKFNSYVNMDLLKSAMPDMPGYAVVVDDMDRFGHAPVFSDVLSYDRHICLDDVLIEGTHRYA